MSRPLPKYIIVERQEFDLLHITWSSDSQSDLAPVPGMYVREDALLAHIEELEAALRESTYYIPEDGVCSRKHPAYYRWLGEEARDAKS